MRGEVGESYWGGACDLLWIFGFGAFWDESTEKKIMVIGWELWGGWFLKLKYREEKREIIAGRVRVMRGGWVQYNFWGESLGWVLRHEGEHREERRDEMRVQRRGDKIKKKKLISGSIDSKKSWLNVFNFITQLPSETCVHCLKSPPATFQNILFKHWFFSNNFQTILFWTDRPNIYFCLLDTSVQCLNTEHCVFSWQTKRPVKSWNHKAYFTWIIF